MMQLDAERRGQGNASVSVREGTRSQRRGKINTTSSGTGSTSCGAEDVEDAEATWTKSKSRKYCVPTGDSAVHFERSICGIYAVIVDSKDMTALETMSDHVRPTSGL